MSNVVKLVREFDGTNLTVQQIKAKARELGWLGLRIRARHFAETGEVIVQRMSRREVLGE